MIQSRFLSIISITANQSAQNNQQQTNRRGLSHLAAGTEIE
jgi:hypothetical protein